jgi:hypothetical protein
MQWSLGGFAASGVLMFWSILAPLCALMFQNTRKAALWFAGYLVPDRKAHFFKIRSDFFTDSATIDRATCQFQERKRNRLAFTAYSAISTIRGQTYPAL